MSETASIVVRVREVFTASLVLGFTSFGRPIAHPEYFRRELIERRRWTDEAVYMRTSSPCASSYAPVNLDGIGRYVINVRPANKSSTPA